MHHPTRRILIAILAGLAASCQPLPPAPPGPSPVPSGAPSGTPALPEPSAPPQASPPPSPAPSDAPSPSASPAAIRLTGIVRNEDGTLVPGLTITLSNDQQQTLATTTTDGNGTYVFDQVPPNTQVTVAVTSNAYGPRSQTYMTSDSPVSLDFIGSLALSNRPEVIKVTPADATTGVDRLSPITLVFSTAVDKASVQRAFALQLNSSAPAYLTTGFKIPGANWPPSSDDVIMDITHFEPTWLGSTTLTLTPKIPIPTTIGGSGMNYRVTLSYNSHVIASSGGREAQPGVVGDLNNGPFRIGSNRPYTTFSVAPATADNLRVIGMRVNANIIRLQFSQTLYWDIAAGRIAGGASGNSTDAPAANGQISGIQAAANYEIQVDGGGYQAFTPANFAGATAYFDDSDSSHQTVILQTTAPITSAGHTVDVQVTNPVMSANGSRLSLNASANVGHASAID